MLESVKEWLVDVGFWEPRASGFLKGRPHLFFWRTPTNVRNRALTTVINSLQASIANAYQLGLKQGREKAVLDILTGSDSTNYKERHWH